jgi:hypothetical protein
MHVCKICQKEFEFEDELIAHRFDCHPLKRPELRIHGQEVGSAPLLLTEALDADDIEISDIETIQLNGNEVHSIDEVRDFLVGQRNDVVTIGLSSQGIEAVYRLRFEIASESDLAGVEDSFMEMVRTHILDRRAIESFVDRSKRYGTALRYCDGICEYLYGILVKERRHDLTCPYAQYRERFSRAADILKCYRRPLGMVISAIVAFHFNQFGEAQQLGGSSRIGSVGQIFQNWINGITANPQIGVTAATNLAYDQILTDWDTERIIIRVCTAEPVLQFRDTTSLLHENIAELDRAKLWILAAEVCRKNGDQAEAAKYARNLLNNPSFGAWAERITERVYRKK